MSTTNDEVRIDIDALDAKKAEEAAKKAKNDGKNAETDAIEVVKADPPAKTPPKEILSADEGLEKLKKQLESETAARIDAERREREASEAELRARTEVHGSQLDLMTNAIATVTQANDVLESKYAEALAASDYAAAAKVQREMGNNAAKLLQLENGKAALEKAPKPTPRASTDPVERFVSQLSPASADWVRAHPDYVRDPKKNQEMLAAHQIAMARGHAADSPGYFQSIERTLDIAKPDTVVVDPPDDALSDAAKPVATRRAPPAAAPVSRSGNGNGSRPNVVTLSAQEVEMAQMMGMTPEEYAKNKFALKREGRLQ